MWPSVPRGLQRPKVYVPLITFSLVTSLTLSSVALYYSLKSYVQTENNGGSSTDDPDVLHPIVPKVPYRLWNLATGSLLRRDTNSPEDVISCNGSLMDMDYNTVATTMGAGRTPSKGNRFAFIFEDNTKSMNYVLNATDGGKKLTAAAFSGTQRDLTDSMRFVPFYYWSFAIFRNEQYNNLYLGCTNNGRALLIPMDNKSYPDPQALFITNKYDLI